MSKFKSAAFAAMMAVILIFTTACINENKTTDTDTDTISIPAEIQSIIDKTVELTANYALQLDGEWADLYNEYIASDQGNEYPGYSDLKSSLDQLRIEAGAYNMYILSDLKSEEDCYRRTINSSNKVEGLEIKYKKEGEMLAAYNGIPSSAMSAFDIQDPTWSAYAPIYGSEGNIVGILGMDFPAPEVKSLPQWNRDSEEWNGMCFQH